jgi:cytidine deaminase
MKTQKLTKGDKELIEKAKSVVNPKKYSERFEAGSVGCALMTDKGKTFLGVCLDLSCGIGFCAEPTAISQMITMKETKIKTIVACNNSTTNSIMYPCGRCREMMRLIDRWNWDNTDIIISENEKVKLKELLPGDWI